MVMPDHSGRRVGGFELIEPIASGGFATVYRARQVRLDRHVAVKVLDPALARDPDIAARFEREGRAAASMDHPNVVPVYEAGEDDGLVYLAMRLVPGETLDELLLREGPMTTARAADLIEPVAAALDHAHQRGLIHRDVKPSNIFVEGDRVWLGDFGIAATTDQVGRYTTGALGTAYYIAPEQASRGQLDGRADLYALGCVVYRCLTGRPPYDRGELVPTLVAHVNEPVPEIGDPGIDRFMATALAKEPARRFPRGADLVAALRSVERVAPRSVASAGAAGATPGQPAPPTLARPVSALTEAPASTASPLPPPLPPPTPGSAARRRWPWAVGAAILLVLLVVGWLVVSGGDGGSADVADVVTGDPVDVGVGPVAVDADGIVFTADVGGETVTAVPGDGGPPAAADVQATPSDVSVAGAQAWVTTIDPDRSVIRLDLEPDQDGQRSFAVALDGFVAAQAAADGDGVWVSDPDGGRVIRLDTAGRQVGTVDVGGRPGDLVEAAGSLWVVDTAADTLVRVDPDGLAVLETVPVEGEADSIAGSDEAVYVTDRAGATITRIDVADTTSRTAVEVVELPTSPAVGADGLWLVSPEAGTLHLYDPDTLVEEQVVDVGGVLGGLAVDGRELWITRTDSSEVVPVSVEG